MKNPRPMTMVKLRFDKDEEIECKTPFRAEEKNLTFLYVGEIVNQEGHGLFIRNKDEKVFVALHIDDFRELTEEEL